MKPSAIEKLKDLHDKVIHTKEATEDEYLKEHKKIKAIKGDWLLKTICERCFPVLNENMKFDKAGRLINN